jgi:hypothetical protein
MVNVTGLNAMGQYLLLGYSFMTSQRDNARGLGEAAATGAEAPQASPWQRAERQFLTYILSEYSPHQSMGSVHGSTSG